MDEIDILQERKDDLALELMRRDLTKEEAFAVLDEMAELDTALQRYFAPLDTIADARLCQRFGCTL
jgi:hypothetical protein